ncbi:hypothetical protein Tco_0764561, partial [Tanacetum coccineum]
MSTRSSARRLLSPIDDPEKLISRRNQSEPSLLFDLEENNMAGQAPPQGLIPDLRSMEELLQAPTDGVGDAIICLVELRSDAQLVPSLSQLKLFWLNTTSRFYTNGKLISVPMVVRLKVVPHYFECQATGGYTQDVYATSGTYNQGGNSYQPQ